MNKIIIILLLIFANLTAFSNEPLCAYLNEGQWHFLDESGEEMFTPPDFTNIAGYRDGYFLLLRKSKDSTNWAYMNTKGEIKISLDVDLARLFRNGRAVVAKFKDPDGYNRTYGIIDENGSYIIEPTYLDAIDYSEGKTYIMKKGERGFINKNGEYIIPMDTLVGYPFFEGMAPVSNKQFKFGYIDSTGKMVIEPQYDEGKRFSEGLASVNINGKIGFIDKNGDFIIRPTFAFSQDFQDGHCFVGRASETYEPIWGIVNKSGLLTVNFKYQDAKGFDMGIGMVKLDDKYFFIDPLGNKIINRDFSYADEFKNGLAWASDIETGEHGFIDPTGKFVVQIPESDVVIDFRVNRRVYFK